MKIKCTSTNGYTFTPRSIRKYGTDMKTDHQQITLDKIYNVYGIILYEEGLDYLIYDDYDMASWYCAELFEVVDHKMPNTWHHRYFGISDEISLSAIWGYHELVFSVEHYNGLLEQEREDVYLFYKRKKEIDLISIYDIESYENEIRKKLANYTNHLINELRDICSYKLYPDVGLLKFCASIQSWDLNLMVYSMNSEVDKVFNEYDKESLFYESKEIFKELEYYQIEESQEDLFFNFYEKNYEILEVLEKKIILEWFLSCWEQSGGLSLKFPVYFLFNDDIKYYDIQNSKWIKNNCKCN